MKEIAIQWSPLANDRRRVFLVTALLAMLAALAGQAGATTINFNNEYYVSSLSEFHTLFGQNTSGYVTAGIYQETSTGTPTVTKLGTTGAPGEFVQNTTPNASQGIQLFGWGGSYNNGTALANGVYNSANPINGSVLYMQYKTGVTGGLFGNGTTTAFNLNSINFRTATTSGSLTFTLEGLGAGNAVLDSALLTVTGNTMTTENLNWAGVTTVEVVSTTAHPVNWGTGTLYLGGITFNNPVPETTGIVAGWMMLLLPFGAMAWRVRRNRCTA